MHRFLPYIASLLSLCLVASAGRAEPGDWDDPSWQVLRAAHIHRDGHSLSEYLRGLCGDDADLGRIDQLVRQLGASDFDEREAAQKALTAAGPAALAKLRALRGDPDAEVARRAGECMTAIEGKWDPEKALAAVRVLVRRGTDEAVPALVRFLPYADSEELQDAVWFGLDALTVRQGKVDAALAAALRDAAPARRAVAACIVGRRGDAGQRAAVRKLLTDAEPEVRLRAAQGLLAAKDAAGLPTLTALLEGTPLETAWQAEELLRYVAGPDSPTAILGAGAAGDRRACREAWEAWWKERGPKIDLAKLDQTNRRPGLMVLCDGGLPDKATGRVWLIGCDGVTRWELRKLAYPTDARLVAGNHVVITERGVEPLVEIPLAPPPRKRTPNEGLSARDLEGKVLWRYRGVDRATIFQRLPNGNWLVLGGELLNSMEIPKQEATYWNVAEVSDDGIEIRVGRLTFANAGWDNVNPGWGFLGLHWDHFVVHPYEEIQPDGATLVAGGTDGFVREYEARSHCRYPSWQCQIPGAFHAMKLPKGTSWSAAWEGC